MARSRYFGVTRCPQAMYPPDEGELPPLRPRTSANPPKPPHKRMPCPVTPRLFSPLPLHGLLVSNLEGHHAPNAQSTPSASS